MFNKENITKHELLVDIGIIDYLLKCLHFVVNFSCKVETNVLLSWFTVIINIPSFFL